MSGRPSRLPFAARLVLLGCMLAPGHALAAERDAEACAVAEGFANHELLSTMRRGVNLPGWDHEDKSRRPNAVQLSALHERGFRHIRLPLDERKLEGEGSEAYLDRMFEQVIFLLSLDYTVSLDLHAGSAIGAMLEADSQRGEARLAELWQAITARVRSIDPQKLAVELLNEPDVSSAIWWEAAGRTAAAIRTILPAHTIIVGPAGPQRHETLAGLQPLADPNVIYAIHYYDPFAFTHQGADWGGDDDPISHLKGLPFPARLVDPAMQEKIAELEKAGQQRAATVLRDALDTPWDEAGMAGAFDTMRDWSVAHDRPVIVNEFGALSHVAPRQARLDWLAAVRRQAEKRCIGWMHWDFQDGFGLIDPETGMPDAGIMQALTPDAD
ncbi:glycoside hydrolase family 5 protein [Mesorhizobium sp. 10J20-29]